MNLPELPDPMKYLRSMSAFDPLKLIRDQLPERLLESSMMAARHIESYLGVRSLELSKYQQNIDAAIGLNRETLRALDEAKSMQAYLRASKEAEQLIRPQWTRLDNSLQNYLTEQKIIESKTFLDAVRSSALLDAYNRATAGLNPLHDLRHAAESLQALEKYRALADIADPLKLLHNAVGSNLSSVLERNFGNSLTNVLEQTLASMATMAGRFELSFEDTDMLAVQPAEVESYSRLVEEANNEVVLSADSIAALAQAMMLLQEQLLTVREKQIFQIYIYPVLLALLFACINPYFDFHIKQSLEAPVALTTEKSVKNAAQQTGAPTFVLNNFRFVSTNKLLVRANGRMNSPVIGQLTFGRSVQILQKADNWMLVQWSDAEKNLQVQGWVLSRYIKKFN